MTRRQLRRKSISAHVYSYFKECSKYATLTRWHMVDVLSAVCEVQLLYIKFLMNTFWHLHGIVADYQFLKRKASPCVSFSFENSLLLLIIFGKQQNVTWKGSKFTIHNYSHQKPLIYCIFGECLKVGVVGCLGVWALCHSYLDWPIPEIFVRSPSGLLLFDLAATLVHNGQNWASCSVTAVWETLQWLRLPETNV